jgi:hypothetical protein
VVIEKEVDDVPSLVDVQVSRLVVFGFGFGLEYVKESRRGIKYARDNAGFDAQIAAGRGHVLDLSKIINLGIWGFVVPASIAQVWASADLRRMKE